MGLTQLNLVILSLFFTVFSYARVDIKNTKVLHLPLEPQGGYISESTKNRILPKNVDNTKSGSEVLAQMADNSVSLWWETTPLRDTKIGQAAETAEKKLNVETEFVDGGQNKHSMNFKVMAVQALAKFEYKGFLNAIFSYDAKASKTEAEIVEKIGEKQDIVVSHSVTNNENKSQLGFRWDW